ncbi:NAD(P)/FAD-dependent oxidoreductase [Congregibacter sp.]|uniref:NAD(P)/FAD-dependent oxidoreductase n=1 Tax=Congregibacter sp. TaxID=2744308 RepID=UPI003F6B8C7A
MKKPRVVIVGGGFAGLACANNLDSRCFAVTLIDRKANFEFLPNIHELLSGVKKPSQLRLSLRSNLRAAGHRFVRGEVTGIDPEQRCLQLDSGERFQADYLVVALGSADADYGVPGVAKHSYGFKSVAQCQAIYQRLRSLSHSGGKIVIIGGGLEGIEALGEVLRRFRDKPLEITLVEARNSLLPTGPKSVGDLILGYCQAWHVACLTADPVAGITPKTVKLTSGRRLRSDLTIWTGGPAPPPLLAESGLAEPQHWAPVDKTLAHETYPQVFIAGDAADLATPISKQAYHALDMGRCIAGNIERLAKAKMPRRYKPSAKPTLLAFGDLNSVLISDRLSLAGPPLAAAKEAVFAAVMAQLDLRSPRLQLDAALGRGKQATQQLLWPSLSNWRALRQQAKVQKLP